MTKAETTTDKACDPCEILRLPPFVEVKNTLYKLLNKIPTVEISLPRDEIRKKCSDWLSQNEINQGEDALDFLVKQAYESLSSKEKELLKNIIEEDLLLEDVLGRIFSQNAPLLAFKKIARKAVKRAYHHAEGDWYNAQSDFISKHPSIPIRDVVNNQNFQKESRSRLKKYEEVMTLYKKLRKIGV